MNNEEFIEYCFYCANFLIRKNDLPKNREAAFYGTKNQRDAFFDRFYNYYGDLIIKLSKKLEEELIVTCTSVSNLPITSTLNNIIDHYYHMSEYEYITKHKKIFLNGFIISRLILTVEKAKVSYPIEQELKNIKKMINDKYNLSFDELYSQIILRIKETPITPYHLHPEKNLHESLLITYRREIAFTVIYGILITEEIEIISNWKEIIAGNKKKLIKAPQAKPPNLVLKQEVVIKDEPTYNKTICHACGGDGGVNSGCQKCEGTGWIAPDNQIHCNNITKNELDRENSRVSNANYPVNHQGAHYRDRDGRIGSIPMHDDYSSESSS